MSSIADEIILKILRRQPTAEEYKRIHALISLYPPEARSSPGAMVDVAVRIDFLRQVEEALKGATWEAQQRIHEDLPKRVDAAAIQALNKIRDRIPFDAADSARRMYKWAAIAMAVTFVSAGAPAYMLGQLKVLRDLSAAQAMVEAQRTRCVDAIIGQISLVDRSRANLGSAALDHVRQNLLNCIAEAESRHVGGS